MPGGRRKCHAAECQARAFGASEWCKGHLRQLREWDEFVRDVFDWMRQFWLPLERE